MIKRIKFSSCVILIINSLNLLYKILGPNYDYSSPIKVGIVSFEDKLSIAFSSVIEDSEIQKGFFTALSKNNIEVKIASSIIEQDLEVK